MPFRTRDPLLSRMNLATDRLRQIEVWQPIASAMPAAAARRQIIRHASGWLMGLSDRTLPL